MIVTALLTSVMMLVCAVPRASYTAATTQNPDFRERDEINQTYQLAPGARVEVSSIRGPVEIVSSDSTTAEVQIIRTARTRADLEHHKVEIEQSGNSLVVRGVQEPEPRHGPNIQVDHQVKLKLPRSVDLSVSSISGWIKVPDVDGQTRLNSISGSARIGNVGGKLQASSISGSLDIGNVGGEVRVNSISGSLDIGNVGGEVRANSISGNVTLAQVNGTLDLTSVSGTVNATLLNLTPEGIHITSVSGSVEVKLKSAVNADFSALNVTGQIYIDVPNVVRQGDINSSNVRARIGAGGTPIAISSVSGNVRLTQ